MGCGPCCISLARTGLTPSRVIAGPPPEPAPPDDRPGTAAQQDPGDALPTVAPDDEWSKPSSSAYLTMVRAGRPTSRWDSLSPPASSAPVVADSSVASAASFCAWIHSEPRRRHRVWGRRPPCTGQRPRGRRASSSLSVRLGIKGPHRTVRSRKPARIHASLTYREAD